MCPSRRGRSTRTARPRRSRSGHRRETSSARPFEMYPGVVHWVVILAGLAACYRTGSEAPCTVQCGASNSCPDDLVCDVSMGRCALANGSCRVVDASTHDVDELIDSPIDSIGRDSPDSPDGPTSGMCNPGSPISVTVLTQGRWFIADRPAQRAVKYDSSLGV